jgi:hypothetical protein
MNSFAVAAGLKARRRVAEEMFRTAADQSMSVSIQDLCSGEPTASRAGFTQLGFG